MTVTLLTTFLAQVKIFAFEGVATYQELTDAEICQQIRQALNRYSTDMPDTLAIDVTGDGGKYYPLLTNLTAWDEGFSQITQIEYPAAVIANDDAPQYLDSADWQDDYWYNVGGTQTRYLYLPNHTPGATETMRITYTLPYAWTPSTTAASVSQTGHGFVVNDYVNSGDGTTWVKVEDSIRATHRVATAALDSFTAYILQTDTPRAHFYAICNLAACMVCQTIATKYSRIEDSAVMVDSAAHVTKAQEFTSRAKRYCDEYTRLLGLGTEDAQQAAPASSFYDWDTAPRYPAGRRYLYHRNR